MPELQGSSGIAPANPSLGSKFPAIRENTENCAILSAWSVFQAPEKPGILRISRVNSLSRRTGNFSRGSGKKSEGSGEFCCGSGEDPESVEFQPPERGVEVSYETVHQRGRQGLQRTPTSGSRDWVSE